MTRTFYRGRDSLRGLMLLAPQLSAFVAGLGAVGVGAFDVAASSAVEQARAATGAAT